MTPALFYLTVWYHAKSKCNRSLSAALGQFSVPIFWEFSANPFSVVIPFLCCL